MGSVFIQVGFCPRERHPVIACDHYDRIVQFTHFFQQVDHATQMSVKPFNFNGVIKQVAPHNLMIREKTGHNDIIEPFSGSQARPIFVRSVRLLTAEPETEWGTLRARPEKILEISRVVVPVDPFKGWCLGSVVVSIPRRIARSPARFPIARSPSFARIANVVSCLFKKFRIDFVLFRKKAGMCACFLQLPDIPSREQGCPAWTALWRWAIGVRE